MLDSDRRLLLNLFIDQANEHCLDSCRVLACPTRTAETCSRFPSDQFGGLFGCRSWKATRKRSATPNLSAKLCGELCATKSYSCHIWRRTKTQPSFRLPRVRSREQPCKTKHPLGLHDLQAEILTGHRRTGIQTHPEYCLKAETWRRGALGVDVLNWRTIHIINWLFRIERISENITLGAFPFSSKQGDQIVILGYDVIVLF